MAGQIGRRTILIGLGASAIGGALAACGTPGGGQSSGPSKGASKDLKKIVYMTNNQDPLAAPTVKKWNAAGKGFTVELRTADSVQYTDSFPRLATAKDAPNIAGYFISGGHYADLAKAGALLELSELWQKSGLTDNVPKLIKDYYSSFTPDGKFYGAPTNTSRYGCFFYRKSVLKSAGITPPENHEWSSEAEFNDACDRLKAKGIAPVSIGGKDGYPISHIQDGLLSSVMAPDKVADPLGIDYTSEEWKAPIKKMMEWVSKGYFARGFLGRSTDQGNTLFAKNGAGFNTGMNVWQPLMTEAGIPLEDLDWCLLPPIGPLPTKMSVYAGGGIVIPSIAEGHAQALEFGEWLLSPERALESAKTGAVIPARTDVPGLEKALGPVGGSMYNRSGESGRSQFGWDDLPPTDMITHDRTNLQAVLAGTMSVDEFCKEMENLKKGHAKQ